MKNGNKESKHLDLCEIVCNWVNGTVGGVTLNNILYGTYEDGELDFFMALCTIGSCIVYFLIVVYRHMHIAKMEKDGNFEVVEFSYKTMKLHICLTIIILVTFVLSFYKYVFDI